MNGSYDRSPENVAVFLQSLRAYRQRYQPLAKHDADAARLHREFHRWYLNTAVDTRGKAFRFMVATKGALRGMSPGAISLRLRKKLGHGLRVAYYRDRVRPRILHTPPVGDTNDAACEVHVLTSGDDWLNLVWALKSFYRASPRRYALCVHDDGTLPAGASDALRRHFPDARIVDRAEADARMSVALKDYPRCRAFRASNKLAIKVLDFAIYLESPRMLLLDSDVLFFAPPEELLRRIDDSAYGKNTVNRDIASAYTTDAAAARRYCDVELIEHFNSGLGVIHRGSLCLDWIEEFLGIPGIIGHFWRIEQTLFALCSSQLGEQQLPPEYNVNLARGVAGRPSRHYVGAIRHLMYGEGVAQLAKCGLIRF